MAKIYSAKVMNWDGTKTLLQRADEHFPRLKHLWVDAGYRGEYKGSDSWKRRWKGQSVSLPRKPSPKDGAYGMS
jgi:hypothetical protein